VRSLLVPIEDSGSFVVIVMREAAGWKSA